MAPALPRSLTAGEAAARLAVDGPNRLPARRRRSPARAPWRQVTHLPAVLLWAAAALAVVAGLAAGGAPRGWRATGLARREAGVPRAGPPA